MNGLTGKVICHGRKLRQRDPLSPMLFVLIIECFNAMICLYTDDVVVFVSLVALDLMYVREILTTFHGAMGLVENYVKCQAFTIRCTIEHDDLVKDTLSCSTVEFPYTYLGVSLSGNKLLNPTMQLLVNKVTKHFPPWKRRLLNRSGRFVLVQSTLYAILVHISALKVVPWAVKAIETLGRIWIVTKGCHAVLVACLKVRQTIWTPQVRQA